MCLYFFLKFVLIYRGKRVVGVDALERRHERGEGAVACRQVAANVASEALVAQRRAEVKVPFDMITQNREADRQAKPLEKKKEEEGNKGEKKDEKKKKTTKNNKLEEAPSVPLARAPFSRQTRCTYQ